MSFSMTKSQLDRHALLGSLITCSYFRNSQLQYHVGRKFRKFWQPSIMYVPNVGNFGNHTFHGRKMSRKSIDYPTVMSTREKTTSTAISAAQERVFHNNEGGMDGEHVRNYLFSLHLYMKTHVMNQERE